MLAQPQQRLELCSWAHRSPNNTTSNHITGPVVALHGAVAWHAPRPPRRSRPLISTWSCRSLLSGDHVRYPSRAGEACAGMLLEMFKPLTPTPLGLIKRISISISISIQCWQTIPETQRETVRSETIDWSDPWPTGGLRAPIVIGQDRLTLAMLQTQLASCAPVTTAAVPYGALFHSAPQRRQVERCAQLRQQYNSWMQVSTIHLNNAGPKMAGGSPWSDYFVGNSTLTLINIISHLLA